MLNEIFEAYKKSENYPKKFMRSTYRNTLRAEMIDMIAQSVNDMRDNLKFEIDYNTGSLDERIVTMTDSVTGEIPSIETLLDDWCIDGMLEYIINTQLKLCILDTLEKQLEKL